MHIHRLSEPIDDFDGLAPLHEWLNCDADAVTHGMSAFDLTRRMAGRRVPDRTFPS